MSKTIDLNLLNKIGDPRKLAERNLESLMERAETPLGPGANGLTAKVLSAFVPREGTSIPLNESSILQKLTQKENHSANDIRAVLDSLQSSKILLPAENGELRMASNVLASQIYNKIEAENIVLRKVENFIHDRYTIFLEEKHLLSEADLNYISHYLPAISISLGEQAFIKKSRAELRRKRKRGFFIASIVISALTLLTAFAGFQYFRANKSLKEVKIQKTLAENARKEAVSLANSNQILAQTNREEADKNAELANTNKQLAITAQKEAEANRVLASENFVLAKDAKQEAAKNAELAQKNQERAEENEQLAKENEKLAKKETKRAEENKKLANEKKIEAEKNDEMRKIAFSQSLAKESLQMDDEEAEIKALLAREAFEVNIKSREGNIFQADIYGAMYDGLKSLRASSGNADFNQLSNERGSIRSIAFANDKPGNTFYTIGSSGLLKQWKVSRWDPIDKPEVNSKVLNKLNNVQNIMKISADNKWLVIAGELPHVLLYNLSELEKEGEKAKPLKINAHNGMEVLTLNFLPDNHSFITSGADNKLQQYHIKDKSLTQLASTESRIEAVAVSPMYPDFIYFGTSGGRFFEMTLGNSPNQISIVRNKETQRGISAIGISRLEDRKVLVVGHQNGLIKIFQSKPGDFFPVNRAGTLLYKSSELHSARISDLTISPDGNYFGIASYDGRASLWNINKMVNERYYQPMIFEGESSWVTSLSFTRRSTHVILGYRDGALLFFNPDPNVYAEAICKSLDRSLTRDEWDLYIGDALDLHYRESCK